MAFEGQAFEAVEILLAGFQAAAARDREQSAEDWLRAALEADDDHFYKGIVHVVLRLVFLWHAEHERLLPVEHPTCAGRLCVSALAERLAADAVASPETMSQRFGAYAQLLALFRAVYFGVEEATLDLPARGGRLFDPHTYPFLEGASLAGTVDATNPAPRARACPPSVDDGTVHRVLQRLTMCEGKLVDYRQLDEEHVGRVYESLLGYHVLQLSSPARRTGKRGVWVEVRALGAPSGTSRGKPPKETADAGTLLLQPGEQRRRTGSHYTPRSLAEEVVKRTLSPLLAGLGEQPTSAQILSLRICDPALGSGAFLLATCRALATEVVAAWTREQTLVSVFEEHGEALVYARALVAQRCLYGVDKDAAAVELAKLSLWLLTRSRALPFTFLDHALRSGDSLVGLDLRQIEAFHWAPSTHTRSLVPASQATPRLRIIADVCVGAFFAERTDAARERERARRLGLVEMWLVDGGEGSAAAGEELARLAAAVRRELDPFHWWLELPEVFCAGSALPLDGAPAHRLGMDGVVGNPPFLGGKRSSTVLGDAYVAWLSALHGTSKNVDLCAHFFRRAASILGGEGAFGLIATNTISQGETRRGGLEPLVRSGFTIYAAHRSMPWPGSAAVAVAVVHAVVGRPARAEELTPSLDGRPVSGITSFLREGSERADAARLASNDQLCFIGCFLRGEGFVLTDTAGRDLRRGSAEAGVVGEFLGGEEVNNSPTHSPHRWAIDLSRAAADRLPERYPEALAILRERVKPVRDALKDTGIDAHHKKKWWLFANTRPELARSLVGLRRCLVAPRVTTHLVFAWQPTRRIFSDQLCVFATETNTPFSVLQSRIHERWARLLSSTLGEGLRYLPSEAVETFPFPRPDPRSVLPHLESIGEALYEARARFLLDTNQGLTKTYNTLEDPACDDPRILELRRLHVELDRAVLEAYGWGEMVVPPYCALTPADEAAVEAFDEEVVARLYRLNEARATEETRAGLRVGRRGPVPRPAQARLPGM